MTTLHASSQRQLRQLVEQLERLVDEHKALAGDIKDKFLEAKGLGFDVKAVKKLIRIRAMGQQAYEEEQAILETYLGALQGNLFEAAGRKELAEV